MCLDLSLFHLYLFPPHLFLPSFSLFLSPLSLSFYIFPLSFSPPSLQLQAPTVKGFDFAKLHLGQHSKDDIMVIQEPGALPVPIKEATPSKGGDVNTPKSKGSSTKAARANRRRGRLVTYPHAGIHPH